MLGRIRLLPGSRVLNQDSSHPMIGTVIESTEITKPADGFVLVEWSDGEAGYEATSDLVLTADIRIDIALS